MYKEDDRNSKYNKDNVNNIYRINIWGGDYNSKEERRTYWGKFNRIFKFGCKDCERGIDFWDVNEYVNEHNFDLEY